MRALRAEAVLTWAYALGFGVPAIPVAIFLRRKGRLPSFLGKFEMYGGPYGFYPPGSLIKDTTEINRNPVLYLLHHAGCPYATVAGLAAAHCINGRVKPPYRMWFPFVQQ